jgi:hypothetical protein
MYAPVHRGFDAYIHGDVCATRDTEGTESYYLLRLLKRVPDTVSSSTDTVSSSNVEIYIAVSCAQSVRKEPFGWGDD